MIICTGGWKLLAMNSSKIQGLGFTKRRVKTGNGAGQQYRRPERGCWGRARVVGWAEQ